MDYIKKCMEKEEKPSLVFAASETGALSILYNGHCILMSSDEAS